MGTTLVYWVQFVIAVLLVLELVRDYPPDLELFDLIRCGNQYKINEFRNKVGKYLRLRERVFFCIGLMMAWISRKCSWCSGLLVYPAKMLWCLLLDTWTALFVMALFILYFGHWEYFPLLDYMESPHKLLYYAIPITIFIAVIAYEFHKCQDDDNSEEARTEVDVIPASEAKEMLEMARRADYDTWVPLRKAVAIAVLVSFPIAVTCNDWHGAYEKHVQQLKHDLGDDWEDYMDEYRIDAMVR